MIAYPFRTGQGVADNHFAVQGAECDHQNPQMNLPTAPIEAKIATEKRKV